MRPMRMIGTIFLSACILTTARAADWTQFRGPDSGSVAGKVTPPVEWADDKNVAWKVKLAGAGWAQPVIVGDSVFIVSVKTDEANDPKLANTNILQIEHTWQLSALDAVSGKHRWTKTVATGKPKYGIHPANSYATETPVANAKSVIALFGATGTIAAFDHAGNEKWKLELGVFPTAGEFGSSSSPLLIDDTVIVQLHNEKKGDLIALDANTGKERWKISRAKPGTSWSTPVIWRTENRTEIVVLGPGAVTSHDPATGKEIWRMTGLESTFSASPAVTPTHLCFGNDGPGTRAQLYSIKAGANGDISLAKDAKSSEFVAWVKNGAGPGMASPVAADGLVYVLSGPTLSCYDLATGEQKYKERLPKGRTIAASPIILDGRLLIVDEACLATSVKLGPQFEVIGTSKLADKSWSSPAVTENALYLRGSELLYCIRKPG